MKELIAARLRLLVMLVIGFQALPAVAQEAWLVTYGPGQEVWERFGHNAIWLRDAELGLDHVYSFGYFEMDRPGFYSDFARGIMKYFGSASSPEDEFAYYRMRDRSIRIQKLDLDSGQISELHRLLHENIYPIPQYYDYDYFFANCSTWLRDLIDRVVAGEVKAQLESTPARLNFRDHIRRYNESRLELHSGLMALLGPMIDRPRTAWEEAFVPDALADSMAAVIIDGEPLVVESDTLYVSRQHDAPEEPSLQWWSYSLVSILAALLVALALRFEPGFWPLLPWRVAALATGLAGVVVLVMWFASGHEVIDGNRAVLMLNPFWLLMLLPLPRHAGTALWWLLAAAAAAGAVVLAWPGSPQYRPQLVFGLAPLLATMLWVWRSRLS
ncbi:lipoprotein N-acyltransferase Lnb domain-containing protein [Wenzhouxiangella sp. EGI_FJ10305]|uniref:lipoprotein N-acyltransferase Lnb domain-containing protein n=1 Tax=Wenzhouxiangella sp. EGI_FJ10305 TaxID=3243768 RepID=UPI0035D6C457